MDAGLFYMFHYSTNNRVNTIGYCVHINLRGILQKPVYQDGLS